MDNTIIVSIMMGLVALGLISVLILSIALGYRLVKFYIQANKGTLKEAKATKTEDKKDTI